jgi:beta-glucosidase
MMDYDLTHGRTYLYSKEKPLYAFGYGLSYTKFAYEKLNTSAAKMTGDGQVEVTVQVKNTGNRASDEVVQLYVKHLASAVERPQLELKGFRRIHVEAGKTVEAKMTIKARDLAYWDAVRHAWHVEKEPVRLLAGGSSDNLPVSAEVQVSSPFEYRP